MPEFHTPPISPMAIAFDAEKLTLSPEGPTLTRRMSDLEGLFLDAEAWAQGVNLLTQDHGEGIQAFREKRKPKFTGA